MMDLLVKLFNFINFVDSGHYYAYIYDNCLNKWLKFNDIHTQDTEESTVMKDAIGGSPNTNAYLLVYVRNDIVNQDNNTMVPMRKYRSNQKFSE